MLSSARTQLTAVDEGTFRVIGKKRYRRDSWDLPPEMMRAWQLRLLGFSHR